MRIPSIDSQFIIVFLLLCLFLSHIQPLKAQTGSTEILRVESSSLWSDYSKTMLKQDEAIQIDVLNDQTWTDWYIETSAEGYTNYFGASLRYVGENTNIFALICCVNQKLDTCQYIGKSNIYTASEDGYLACFANDVSYMYWNNKGSLDLTLTF
jgi:hypothetical protein